MDEGNSTIYGLEHQARALAPQIGENDAVRFLIGTQSLKPNNNQLHVVELEEETGALHTKVYQHDSGEIWHLRCSPHDAALFTTCHNSYNAQAGQCTMGVQLYRLPTLDVIPTDDKNQDMQTQLEVVQIYDVEKYGQEIKSCEFHGTDVNRLAIVVDNSVLIMGLDGNLIRQIQLEGKGHLKFHGGRWNPHQNGYQFVTIQDTHLKSYDTREETTKSNWSLESAHSQHIRDLDFNPNRQFYLATVADDGLLKIWDYRNTKEPVFSRSDHSHWIWSVRFNTFHDQLILTGSSDARVLLTCAASVSSESSDAQSILQTPYSDDLDGDEEEKNEENDRLDNNESDSSPDHKGPKERLTDGVLQCYEQHEDSVYCIEWSSADPWTFASLSYDGRLVISTVPRQYKYKILL